MTHSVTNDCMAWCLILYICGNGTEMSPDYSVQYAVHVVHVHVHETKQWPKLQNIITIENNFMSSCTQLIRVRLITNRFSIFSNLGKVN